MHQLNRKMALVGFLLLNVNQAQAGINTTTTSSLHNNVTTAGLNGGGIHKKTTRTSGVACNIHDIYAVVGSVDDCEKAGGSVIPRKKTANQ